MTRLIPTLKVQLLREIIEHLQSQCETSEYDAVAEENYWATWEHDARKLFLHSRLIGLEINGGRIILRFPEGTMVVSRTHGILIEAADGEFSFSGTL